jgi:hypothetical protein
MTSTLPSASVVKHRRLAAVAGYLARGQAIDAGTMMPIIMSYLNTPVAPVMNQIEPALPPRPPDPSRGALRLYVNSLEEYSGSPIDFEDWELKTRATLGQTTYA